MSKYRTLITAPLSELQGYSSLRQILQKFGFKKSDTRAWIYLRDLRNQNKIVLSKPSKIEKILHSTHQQILEAIASSFSTAQALQRLGVVADGASHTKMTRYIVRNRISTTHFKRPTLTVYRADTLLVECSNASRSVVKSYIIRNKLIPYECSKCSNKGMWNGAVLTLQLDHINGVRQDHRLENLRFLCPNCHSQTETFGRKKRK